MKLSLRLRLTLWHTAVLAVALIAFGVYVYFALSKNLSANLNAGLVEVADAAFAQWTGNSGDGVQTNYAKNQDFDGEALWPQIYKRIFKSPKMHYIQISDSSGKALWATDNLKEGFLPAFGTNHAEKDSSEAGFIENFFSGGNSALDSVFSEASVDGKNLRVYSCRRGGLIVSVGYPTKELKDNLNKLSCAVFIGVPAVLFIALFGGLYIARFSLKSIDEITTTANEITANNLSLRLKSPGSNDELGRLVDTLNNMIERLESSFVQIKQFTSDASHELKTPLTILFGELEIALRNSKTPEEYEDVILSGLEEVTRLTNVVETLLELSRADSGQASLDFQRANLSKLIDDLIEDAEILAEEKNIKVDSSVENEIYLKMDPPRIHQAVLNLIDNAIKYTAPKGEIFIELKRRGDAAEIKVEDSGSGIPGDQLKKIFDRFFRVDKSRTNSRKGVGLGLSIVKWIVDAHGGEIYVSSSEGKGSVFRIALPIKRKK